VQHLTKGQEQNMKIRIECWAHDVKPVISAEQDLHWFYDDVHHEYQLDEGNLYCTGGEGEHEFVVQLDLESGQTMTFPLLTVR
jgi:hypothetical protein